MASQKYWGMSTEGGLTFSLNYRKYVFHDDTILLLRNERE